MRKSKSILYERLDERVRIIESGAEGVISAIIDRSGPPLIGPNLFEVKIESGEKIMVTEEQFEVLPIEE